MIDSDAVLIAYLRSCPELAGLSGRVYAATELPPGTTALQLPAALVQARGGQLHYSAAAMTVNYQALVFGETEGSARQAAGLLFDVLTDRHGGGMVWARADGPPVLLRDPEARWPYALLYFTAHFH